MSAAVLSVSAYAQDFTVGGIKYSVLSDTEKTCQLTDGKSVKGSLDIPASVKNGNDDYAVVKIGEEAFEKD